jgi:hypothetical protein
LCEIRMLLKMQAKPPHSSKANTRLLNIQASPTSAIVHEH